LLLWLAPTLAAPGHLLAFRSVSPRGPTPFLRPVLAPGSAGLRERRSALRERRPTTGFRVTLSPRGLAALLLAAAPLLALGSLLVLAGFPPSLSRLSLLLLLLRPRLTTELPALLVLVVTLAPHAPTTALPVPPDVAARTLRAFA